jgi:hypothetical protein
VRRSHSRTVDHQHAGIDCVLNCFGGADRPQFGNAEVGAQRHGEQQPAHAVRQARHARAQHLLHAVWQRDLTPDLRQPLLDECAPKLQDEQRIAQRELDDPAQQIARQAQT